MTRKEARASFRRWRLRLYKVMHEAILDPIVNGWDEEIAALVATPGALLRLVTTTALTSLALAFAAYHMRTPLASNAMNFLIRDMLSSALLVLSLFALLLRLPSIKAFVQSMPGKVALFFATTGILLWAKAQTAAVLANIFPVPTGSLPWAMLLGTVYSTAGFVAICLLYGSIALEVLVVGPVVWRAGKVKSSAHRLVIFLCGIAAVLVMFTSGSVMTPYLGDRGQMIAATTAFALDFRPNHKCDAAKGEVVAYLGDGVEKAIAVRAPNLKGISLYELESVNLSDRLPKRDAFKVVACNAVGK
ncbi:hypothetical protein N5I84_03390 [Ralstonia sp. CHL-2022]|uniref:hypothetical protein n=1 Tax=Ralstonia mojiangensis TaxID=2953895 RepID=UPI0021B19F9A|nr:hypothetical protein [Ralstonia mojiangensis]MCT7295201.1 hypothetical protein [Ralstonia mojiangensis]